MNHTSHVLYWKVVLPGRACDLVYWPLFVQESTFKFRPGQFPAYRQMFYQLCDIELPEIQALVHQNDGQVGNVIR